ncbi:MAG: class I SAM-dependent methyltransferase, partial [Pseudomonadota bacterium]
PAINQPYENPDVARWRGVFERPGREIFDRREQIVAAVAVEPGDHIADVGAGTGLFSLMFARAVGPEGRVYAVDISDEFVHSIEERARRQGFDNILGVINNARDVSLAPASIDLAFVCDTYHHFEYPGDMLASTYQALKPGGGLVVVDFRRRHGVSSPWVMGHVRAGEAAVRGEVEAAGFEFVESLDFMRGQYYLRFRKPAAPGQASGFSSGASQSSQ